MRKDSPRRKIVDAIDFLTDEDSGMQVTEVFIDTIDDFSDHPFHLYDGKRLEDLIESIKVNGILNPVIVRKRGSGRFEMLAGHNRKNAAKLAGLNAVPAFIKEDLSDEDAYIYVIETNLMQRSFNDMYPSEKAAVLALRYEKVSSQGKRTDIMKELRALEEGEETNEEEQVIDSRGRIAKEYGLSGRSMARLLRINHLTEEWKQAVDNAYVAFMVGVELSYISEELQASLYKESKDMGIQISLKDVKALKQMYKNGELDDRTVSKYLIAKEKQKLKKREHQNIKISGAVIEKYFDKSTSEKEIQTIIQEALHKYFHDQGEDV